jgi:CheY-like chemotaxis protein
MFVEKLDKRFGIVAVENGFISREQLIDAMQIQIDDELKGAKHRLVGEILRGKEYITDTQINEVLGSIVVSDELRVIIVDDDPYVCKVISAILENFYTWGEVIRFTDVDKAISYCLNSDIGIAIFIVDVFLDGKSGFYFLDAIEEKFPTANEDVIMITGNASDDIVNKCISSDVTCLLEKPIRPYALQLAVRAIVMKYLAFGKRLLQNPALASNVSKL